MSRLFPLNNNGCANDTRSCRDIDQKGLVGLWCYHNRRGRQEELELSEGLIGLLRLGETLLGFKQLEERETFFA